MTSTLSEYYRCPDEFYPFELSGKLSDKAGYFRFGETTVCYGRSSLHSLSETFRLELTDVSAAVKECNSKCLLPFEATEILDNLRLERYANGQERHSPLRDFCTTAYYRLRPILPFKLRSCLKRVSLKGWDRKGFPAWPVDRTVEEINESLICLAMKTLGIHEIPFVWFWPEGRSGCAVMTHDVETRAGLEFCDSLMDLDDSYGIKSSFQVIPEGRYLVSAILLQQIRSRGFEANVHDWNHDGLLFKSPEVFLTRAEKINQFAATHSVDGFRSGALYRNVAWYDALSFAYDMSVPNSGRLDPQWGGCCTTMPYFIGRILEIPVTTTQDYMLFHLLGTYSTALWQQEAERIFGGHGLASFIVHPDYVIEKRARNTYKELLEYLSSLRSKRNIWIARPGEVNEWWRNRSQMKLVHNGSTWTIEGPNKERACVAYATLQGEELTYCLESGSSKHDRCSPPS